MSVPLPLAPSQAVVRGTHPLQWDGCGRKGAGPTAFASLRPGGPAAVCPLLQSPTQPAPVTELWVSNCFTLCSEEVMKQFSVLPTGFANRMLLFLIKKQNKETQ